MYDHIIPHGIQIAMDSYIVLSSRCFLIKSQHETNFYYFLQHNMQILTLALSLFSVEDLASAADFGKTNWFNPFGFQQSLRWSQPSKILYKLSTFGITGNTLKWIEAFFNWSLSNCCTGGGVFQRGPGHLRGTPAQGYVLGPLLPS